MIVIIIIIKINIMIIISIIDYSRTSQKLIILFEVCGVVNIIKILLLTEVDYVL